MLDTLKMASMFSQVPCIPSQKCRDSKISARKTQRRAVIRACIEPKSPPQMSTFDQEITVSAANFALPLFIHEGEADVPIEYMPGHSLLGWRHGLLDEVYKARDVGVKSFLLYPKDPNASKTLTGEEAYNDNSLIPRAIRLLKDKYPDIVIYTDVALEQCSSDWYDRFARRKLGVIMNDEAVHQLCKQAVCQARAGADVVNSSDMMDGHARALRASLNEEGFHNVTIMSSAEKYASSLYGPSPKTFHLNPRIGDKETYQYLTDCKALIEMEDTSEGVGILLTEARWALFHTIRLLREHSYLPIAAYQVSSQYAMIKCRKPRRMDEDEEMMESLRCFRWAGADIILTYFARQAAALLAGEK